MLNTEMGVWSSVRRVSWAAIKVDRASIPSSMALPKPIRFVRSASAFPTPLSNNPAPAYYGHWPSSEEIGGKRDHGSAAFKKYDDGWRIVMES